MTTPRRLASHYPKAVLALLTLLLPIVLIGADSAIKSNSNDPRQWLPDGFDETDKYVQFHKRFGRDEISVVTWDGCTLDDRRVSRLAEALAGDTVADDSRYFERAMTGGAVLEQLTSPPLNLNRAEAIRRLKGTLIGDDGRTTCVVLVISELGLTDRMEAVEQIYRVAESECGLARDQLRLGGPTVDAATIDLESRRLMLGLTGVAGLIALCVTWWRLRSFRLTVMVLLGAGYSVAATLATLYYSGGHMNLLMTMLPPLVFVLSLSAAVHLINYYRDAIAEGDLATAPQRAMAHGWWPCLLASATTAVGLLSLSTSTIVPIRDFGVYSAVGMGISIAVLFLFLPAALAVWPLEANGAGEGRQSAGPQAGDKNGGQADHGGKHHRRRRDVISLVERFHRLLTYGCLALMAGLGWGLLDLKSTVKLQHRFAPDSRIMEDYRWMEKNLGPLVPLELVVHFDPDCPLDFFRRMEFVAALQREINTFQDVGATMSAADFAPPLPQGNSVRDVARRAILARKLPQGRQTYIDAHFLSQDPSGEFWRISVRVNALSDVDYGYFIETLRSRVDPMIDAKGIDGVRAIYTGVIPLIYKAQRQLFADLVRSFLLAFGVIAVVMMVALGSIPAGLLAMVPNLFPAVVIFGFMGWTGRLIEIGSVMTASAALGIAVDDTFHFLTWFSRGSRDGMSRHESLAYAFRRCATPMINTTIICASGMAIFSLSTFMPVVHFAWLMVMLLTAALVGDLILLPAMLAGPAGKVFERKS